MLTESLLLALAGGVGAAAVAAAGISLVKAFGPPSLPRLQEAGVNPRVFAFAFVITLLTGVLFGLAPALGAGRVNLAGSLREGGQKGAAGASHPRLGVSSWSRRSPWPLRS